MNFVPMAVTAPDHPRSRGVYNAKLKRALTRIGSSPLARGLPGPAGAPDPEGGIIPARAGFTVECISEALIHPRIIPARAGFTIQTFCGRFATPDHPRSRGVYGTGPPGAAHLCGSSPLARGLLAVLVAAEHGCRIIPARAGFT